MTVKKAATTTTRSIWVDYYNLLLVAGRQFGTGIHVTAITSWAFVVRVVLFRDTANKLHFC